MATRFEEEDATNRAECENCGATSNLLRCSRCHSAWFCSLKCHKAYWPFHKTTCKKNDFADATEQQEPKFANWMRRHGKLAVLQDDEVDRLERAGRPGGWRGLTRDEVMESMYGRMDPRPAAPTYDDTSAHCSAAVEQHHGPGGSLMAAPSSASERTWLELQVPEGFGLNFTHYKWRQNLSHVEVFVRLPGTPERRGQVKVQLTPSTLEVTVAGHVLLGGRLYADIKLEGSTWYRDEDILYIVLLKRNRKGCYADGCTAASTYWFSLLASAQGADRLQLDHPPTAYYSSPCEADDFVAAG